MRWFVYFALCGLLLWGGLFILFAQLLPTAALDTTGQHYDAAIVLTGGQGRIDEGFTLYAEGKIDALYISGVGEGVAMAALLQQYNRAHPARSLKISRQLSLDDKARSTVANVIHSEQWLSDKPYRKMLLVTAGYHMPRSYLLFTRAMPQIEWVPAPVFPKEYHPQSWWKDSRSLALVMSEYHKYVAMQLLHLIS